MPIVVIFFFLGGDIFPHTAFSFLCDFIENTVNCHYFGKNCNIYVSKKSTPTSFFITVNLGGFNYMFHD